MASPIAFYAARLKRASKYVLRVTYYQADGVTPVNLTGYGAHWSFREGPARESPVVLGPFTPGAGLTITPAAGTIDLVVPATGQLANPPTLDGWHDLFLDPNGSPDGSSFAILEGSVNIAP